MDQLLQPLVLPLTHHGVVYRMLPLTKGSKALVLCGQFSRSSATQAHVSNVHCAAQKFFLTVHARNMLAQTTQVKWRTFPAIVSFPFSLMQTLPSIFLSCKRVPYSNCFWTFNITVCICPLGHCHEYYYC